MLAGVGGIDLVLLVIAADESIKPQTREHFDICRLLGVRRGITCSPSPTWWMPRRWTWCGWRWRSFCSGSFLKAGAHRRREFDDRRGTGRLEARDGRGRGGSPAARSQALARLPIDRVFTMKGFGTVVTGTLISGTIRKEQELEVYPTGRRVRVRGVQVHGGAAD